MRKRGTGGFFGVGAGVYEGALQDLVGLRMGILVCRPGLAGVCVLGFKFLGCGKDGMPFNPWGRRGKALFGGSAYLAGASLGTHWRASLNDAVRYGALGFPTGREKERVGEGEGSGCILFRFPRTLAPSSAWVSKEVAGRWMDAPGGLRALRDELGRDIADAGRDMADAGRLP